MKSNQFIKQNFREYQHSISTMEWKIGICECFSCKHILFSSNLISCVCVYSKIHKSSWVKAINFILFVLFGNGIGLSQTHRKWMALVTSTVEEFRFRLWTAVIKIHGRVFPRAFQGKNHHRKGGRCSSVYVVSLYASLFLQNIWLYIYIYSLLKIHREKGSYEICLWFYE